MFDAALKDKGYEVVVSDTLESYADTNLMDGVDLVVPIWTMGQIKPEQEKGLLDAVNAGCGLAGFHGGMCDAFRANIGYQWMTGGQFLGHPGNCYPRFTVKITDKNHEITRGLKDFDLTDPERYSMMVDPHNHVLGQVTFDETKLTVPFMWTKTWGQGRVFFAAWGHTYKEFDVPEAREIVLRGMLWASK